MPTLLQHEGNREEHNAGHELKVWLCPAIQRHVAHQWQAGGAELLLPLAAKAAPYEDQLSLEAAKSLRPAGMLRRYSLFLSMTVRACGMQ